MKKNRIEFAYAHFVLKWKHFMAFPKKENGLPVEKSNLFQCKSRLFAEVSNRSHAGKADFNLTHYAYI